MTLCRYKSEIISADTHIVRKRSAIKTVRGYNNS